MFHRDTDVVRGHTMIDMVTTIALIAVFLLAVLALRYLGHVHTSPVHKPTTARRDHPFTAKD